MGVIIYPDNLQQIVYHSHGVKYRKMKEYDLMKECFDKAGNYEDTINEICNHYLYDVYNVKFDINKLLQFDSPKSINNIISYYYFKDMYKEMMHFCKIGIKQKNESAMFLMGEYYKNINEEKMLKYYLMGVEHQSLSCMLRLAEYYSEKNIVKTIKYYEMCNALFIDCSLTDLIECYIDNEECDKAYEYAVKINKLDLLFRYLIEKNNIKYLIKYMGTFKHKIITDIIDMRCEVYKSYPKFDYLKMLKNYNKYMKYDPDEEDRLNKETVSKLFTY